MSMLEKKLDSLIAAQDHIRPEEVTLEHIRKTRDKNQDIKYDFSTRYGGYNRRGRRVLTIAQSNSLVRSAYQFLSRFGRS